MEQLDVRKHKWKNLKEIPVLGFEFNLELYEWTAFASSDRLTDLCSHYVRENTQPPSYPEIYKQSYYSIYQHLHV